MIKHNLEKKQAHKKIVINHQLMMINAHSYGCQVLPTTTSKRLDIYICWNLGQVFVFHFTLFELIFDLFLIFLPGLQVWWAVPVWFQVCAAGCRPPSHFWTTVYLQWHTQRITVLHQRKEGRHRGLGSRFLWVDRIQFTGVHTGKKLSCCSVSWHIIGMVKVTPASLNPEKSRWQFAETQPQHPEYITITIILSIATCRGESTPLVTAVAHNNTTDFHPMCLSFFLAQAGRRRYYAWATWREFLIVRGFFLR